MNFKLKGSTAIDLLRVDLLGSRCEMLTGLNILHLYYPFVLNFHTISIRDFGWNFKPILLHQSMLR